MRIGFLLKGSIRVTITDTIRVLRSRVFRFREGSGVLPPFVVVSASGIS